MMYPRALGKLKSIAVLGLCLWSSISYGASSPVGKTYTGSYPDITKLIADDRYLWAGTTAEGLL